MHKPIMNLRTVLVLAVVALSVLAALVPPLASAAWPECCQGAFHV